MRRLLPSLLLTTLTAGFCWGSGGDTYIQSLESSPDKTVEAAANDPGAVSGGSGLHGKAVDYAKDLAGKISGFRGNFKSLVSLLSPDTPTFGDASTPQPSRSGMRSIISKYKDNPTIPFSCLGDYLSEVGKPGEIGATYFAADIILLVGVANDEMQILLNDGYSPSSVRARTNSYLNSAENLCNGLEGELKNSTLQTIQKVRPMFEQALNNPPAVDGGAERTAPARGGGGVGSPAGGSLPPISNPLPGAGSGSGTGLGNRLGSNFVAEATSNLPSPEDPVPEPTTPDESAIYKQVQGAFKPDLEEVQKEVVIDPSSFPKEIVFGTDPVPPPAPDPATPAPAPIGEPPAPISVPPPLPPVSQAPYQTPPTLTDPADSDSDPVMKSTWEKLKDGVSDFYDKNKERAREWILDKLQDKAVDYIQETADEEHGIVKPEEGFFTGAIKGFVGDKVREKLIIDNPELETKKELWNAGVYFSQGFYKGLYDWNKNHMETIKKGVSSFKFDNGEGE